MKTKELFLVWKNVFSKPKYLFFAVLIAFLFYALNVFIANFHLIIYFFRDGGFFSGIAFFFNLIYSFKGVILPSSFVSLVVISILVGIFFSLIFYRAKILKDLSGKSGMMATTGIFFGVLAPGCAACGLGILPILGIGAATLNFLPLKGLEISILSILILGFLNFKITKDIDEGIKCNTK